MVSNIGLPASKIGSWTNYMDHFNGEDTFFDFVLSPGKESGSRYIQCIKRKWITYHPWLRNYQLLNWVSRDFVNAIARLSQIGQLTKIVVFDDIVLLEAIARKKESFAGTVELIFYFHGFELTLSDFVQNRVNKVLFLSKTSYLHSLDSSLQFTPEAVIIGNGIDSTKFFPLGSAEKSEMRKALQIPTDKIVVSWMANNRPVKGLPIFLNAINSILQQHTNLYVLLIGADAYPTLSDPRIRQIGRVPHEEIPKYLQCADFYFFTSLWKEGFGLSVVEAAKCGNWILASRNGSIPEVMEEFAHVYLVDYPNIVQEWCGVFQAALDDFTSDRYLESHREAVDLHSYPSWKSKFRKAIG